MIFAVVYYYFMEPETIGHDPRYALFIFYIPNIAGIITLGFYRRKFLIYRFATNKGFVLWTFMVFIYIIQGILFSYLIFGQLARLSWDLINYQTAKNNPVEIVQCDVTRFWVKRNPSIDFKFNNRHESFKVQYSAIKQYQHGSPEKYRLSIEVQKGVWNYCLVNDWEVQHK